jgi:hypothetical protein
MDDTTKANEERFPWQVRVTDELGFHAYVKLGVDDGVVFVEAPAVYRMDPDEADLLDFAVKAAADRARRQRQAQSAKDRREH